MLFRSLSIIAEKNDLHVEYSNYNNINNRLGVTLFIGKNKYSNTTNVTDYTYLKPKDYLPNIGFQSLENLMTNQCKKIGDPNGFCAAWCIWWIYQRIKYSHLD